MKISAFILLPLLASFVAIAQNKPAQALNGHQMLITSVRTGETEIFLIDPATGDARNLSRSPNSEDRYPMWSPDGKRVVFTSNRDGDAFNIFVMDADGKNVRKLTQEKEPAVCYFPTWQGDGKRIIFGLDRSGKGLIASVAPDGSDFRIIADGRDPCISPDGKKIAFTTQVGKGFCVFVMDADGKNVRQLTTHEDEIGAVCPTWSPDGKKILYSDQVGEALEIFVCDADGKNQKQLTSLGKISSSPGWSPDGQWISFRVTDTAYWRNAATREKAYQDKEGDKRPVWVMKADGSQAQLLEVLRYQCAIDGSRAAWKPNSGTK
jgi:TolB protein